MRKLYLRSLALLPLATAAALSAQIPEDLSFSDYRGDSFTANWSGTLTDGKLNVFMLTNKYVDGQTDFQAINATDGKIDTANPNYPTGWSVGLEADGATDIIDGNLLLDANGEYIQLDNVPGELVGFDIHFKVLNASSSSSSIFRFEYYNNAGVRMGNATVYMSDLAKYDHVDVIASTSLRSTDFTSARVVLVKEDGQQGDLLVESVNYRYRAYRYDFREPVTAGPVTVTGLDPEQPYYMYLSEGEQQGYMVTVDPILTPELDTPADITATSYTARWKYTPKSVGYEVTNYRIEEVTPGQAVSVIRETFSKADQGTVAEPQSIDDPNEYADVQGWEGRNFIMAQGMVGANKGAFPRNPSYLWSPKMNLSAADGKYTIHLKAHGTPGNNLNLYRIESDPTVELNIHSETFDADGVIDATWTMEDGTDDMQISFEESRLRAFLVDEFEITQTYEAKPEEKNILAEEFSKADQGTVDEPQSIDDPNEYADVQGWEGRNFIMAQGMVGANKGAFPRNPSYLWSPKMNLSAADGKYTIRLKAYGTPGNNLNLYRIESDPTVELNIHSETFDADGVIDAIWTMEDGTDDMQISFEESRLRPFLVDSFVVSQTFAAGSVITVPLSTAIIESGSELSHTFTDLNSQSVYGYDVKAIREDESTSERSELQRVSLKISSVEGVAADEIFSGLSIEGSLIHTVFTQPTAVEVYDINGRCVESIIAPAGSATLTLSANPGIYVVKSGDTAVKAIIR